MAGFRRAVAIALFSCCLPVLAAQESPIHRGATELGVWAGGGPGLGHSSSAQFVNAGFRFGKVLTAQHGAGFLRGNLEYAVDIDPLYLVFQDQPVLENGIVSIRRQTVYGGAISPFILKWNFTKGRRIVPFAAAEGTVIFTTSEIPAGNTSTVNFGPAFASGVQFFRDDHHALSIAADLVHISNASLGKFNPSYNITLQFRLGYHWWK